MASPLPGMRIRRSRILIATMVFAVLSATTATTPPSVDAACGSFQSRVNSAKTGSTITIPKCTFHESVVIGKRLTINAYGATIDADGAAHGLLIQANDVTVNGISVTGADGGAHDGVVHTNGASRFTLRNANVYGGATVCLSLNGGSGHRILNSSLRSCGKEGYFGNQLSKALFQGNKIHHNNTNLAWDPQSEAGGGKVMASSGITFDHNSVWSNGGPGIWFDNGVKNVVVRYNRVRDNHESGIMFEISSGARIYGNNVWNNGFGHAAWAFGAGILISSSDGADVYKNVVAWNARGISVISQGRELSPHNDNVVHGNFIFSKSNEFVNGFYDDHGGSLFDASHDNRGYGNRYWVSTREPSGDRFGWDGPVSRLSSFNSTRGEQGGKYISKAYRNTILNDRKMPLS